LPTKISEKPEKKAKVRARHADAIAEYMKWLHRFPKATREKRIRQFDFYVDSAKLKETLDRES
jgi:hypothetical protein